MTLLPREKAAHWYLPDGTPFFEVPNASKPGESRPVTKRDAAKVGALRSVTTWLRGYPKPGLTTWLQEQAILAALTLPRVAGEPEDVFVKRVIEDMGAQGRTAAELGTAVHDSIALILQGEAPDPLAAPYLEKFSAWLEANQVVPHRLEFVAVGDGYAGRLDFYGSVGGRKTYLDFKTQNVRKGTPTFYGDWALQLAAYRAADGDRTAQLGNVVIPTNEPGQEPVLHIWQPDNDLYRQFRNVMDVLEFSETQTVKVKGKK